MEFELTENFSIGWKSYKRYFKYFNNERITKGRKTLAMTMASNV